MQNMQKKIVKSVYIACSAYYEEISACLLASCEIYLHAKGYETKVGYVYGAWELAILIDNVEGYDGYIALGCVVRGQTSHYEVIVSNSSRGLMDVALKNSKQVVNGVLTVETMVQAYDRAKGKNIGWHYAHALHMLMTSVDDGR